MLLKISFFKLFFIQSKFKCDFEEHKSHLDKLTEQCISDYLKEVNQKEKVDDLKIGNEEVKDETKNEREDLSSDEKISKQRSKRSPISSTESSDENNIKKLEACFYFVCLF